METVELLFWIPTVVDVLLLIFTYTSCRWGGAKWYFDTLDAQARSEKKNDGAPTGTTTADDPRVQQVWQLAMAAYSAYACTFPWAVYQCVIQPDLRVGFCAMMTVLMLLKLENVNTMGVGALKESKNLSLLVFNLPTYGGYALIKTLMK